MIPIDQVAKDVLDRLPRTTLWRAKKRGYITVGYHTAWGNRLCNARQDVDIDRDYKEARSLVYRETQLRPFPNYMSDDDLVEECVIELWRVSAKDGYEVKAWRFETMRRRLYQISKLVRGDRDARNVIPENGEGETR